MPCHAAPGLAEPRHTAPRHAMPCRATFSLPGERLAFGRRRRSLTGVKTLADLIQFSLHGVEVGTFGLRLVENTNFLLHQLKLALGGAHGALQDADAGQRVDLLSLLSVGHAGLVG